MSRTPPDAPPDAPPDEWYIEFDGRYMIQVYFAGSLRAAKRKATSLVHGKKRGWVGAGRLRIYRWLGSIAAHPYHYCDPAVAVRQIHDYGMDEWKAAW